MNAGHVQFVWWEMRLCNVSTKNDSSKQLFVYSCEWVVYIGELLGNCFHYCVVIVMWWCFLLVLCHWSDNLSLTSSLCIKWTIDNTHNSVPAFKCPSFGTYDTSVSPEWSQQNLLKLFESLLHQHKSGDQRNYTSPKNVKFEHNSCRRGSSYLHFQR